MSLSRPVRNSSRVAGILLVSSFLVLMLALVILIASGALPGFSANLQGALAKMAPYASTFRRLNLFWTASWIIQLMGFGLLAHLLLKAGEEQLAILSFTAILVAAMLGVLHGTFHMSVETWAAEEAATTGNIPEMYEALDIWISSAFRIAYILHLLGTAGIGWSLLRTKLLATWIGWMAIGWSMLWVAGYLVGAGLPAVLFIMPAVIGAALLMKASEKSG